MSFPIESRNEGCLSDLLIDRWITGELEREASNKAGAHVETCAVCRDRRETILRERSEFESNQPARVVTSSRFARWSTIAGASLALAAGIAIAALSIGDPETIMRSKGKNEHVAFWVLHRGDVRRGVDGDRVEPGDALRFGVTAKEMRHVAILSLDPEKKASVYYPLTAHSIRVEGGKEVLFSSSTILDDTIGRETIWAVFCPSAFDLEPLRAQLEADGDFAKLSPGCTKDQFSIEKHAP